MSKFILISWRWKTGVNDIESLIDKNGRKIITYPEQITLLIIWEQLTRGPGKSVAHSLQEYPLFSTPATRRTMIVKQIAYNLSYIRQNMVRVADEALADKGHF